MHTLSFNSGNKLQQEGPSSLGPRFSWGTIQQEPQHGLGLTAMSQEVQGDLRQSHPTQDSKSWQDLAVTFQTC